MGSLTRGEFRAERKDGKGLTGLCGVLAATDVAVAASKCFAHDAVGYDAEARLILIDERVLPGEVDAAGGLAYV